MPITKTPSALLTTDEAREYLGGKSRDFIYRLVRNGEIVSIKLSERGRRITRESLDRYIAELVEQSTDGSDQDGG